MISTLTTKQKVMIGCIAGAFILLFASIFMLRGCKNGNSKYANIYNLAKTYADKGEYDRALSLLDSILIKDVTDPTALDLLNQIIEMKKAAEEGKEIPGWSNVMNYPGNLKVDIDTDGLTDAMQNSLSSMRDAMAEANKQAEENRRTMENLIKMQEEQKKNDDLRRADEEKRRIEDEKRRLEEEKKKAADDELKKAEEAEKKAKEAAAAEQRRLQEEKRKQEEAELAKKNAQLKKEIDAVNDEIQKGKTALAMGNVSEAMEHFKKAEQIMPGSAGEKFLASKNSEMAQSLYDAAEKSENQETKNQLMNQAVDMARKAIAENPKDAGSHYIIAQDAINKKDFNLALTELSKAVENDPSNYLYYYDLGKVQYRLKKYNEAVSSFTTACDLKQDFAPSRYNLGLTQKVLRNDSAALAAFRKTIDIDPRHEKAWLEEARILTSRGDFSGAEEAYESVLKLNNINISAAMELGSVYYKDGKLSRSEDSYRKALTMLRPSEDMTLTKYNLSTVLFDAGKFLEAEKYAREAYDGKDFLANNKSKANIIYNYALILDKDGKMNDAIPLYMEVLEYNPDHQKTKINLGVMYMTIQPPDVDTALALFTQVYNKEKGNFEANNNLGSAYLLKQDYDNAILFFQNALRIDSKNNEVRSNLAKAYTQNKDYSNAKTTYTELLKYDSKNWDAYISLAKICMELGENDTAEKYLIYVQEKNPDYKSSEIKSLLQGLKI